MLPCGPTEACTFLSWSVPCLPWELSAEPRLSSTQPVFLKLGSTLRAPRGGGGGVKDTPVVSSQRFLI